LSAESCALALATAEGEVEIFQLDCKDGKVRVTITTLECV